MTGRTRVALHGGLATIAASSALVAVFQGVFDWLFPVVGAVLVVVIVSELVRWSPLPAATGPVLAAAGVFGYLTALYAGDVAIAHVIPNGAALHKLADTARTGFHDIRNLSTPVPTHRGLVMLAVIGVCAVALVVDLFAVTMRRAALAGLPLLTIFAVCTSTAKHGAGLLPFVIGTTGYLWLLLADSRDRLARWGRPMGFDRSATPHFNWSDTEVMPSPLSVMGRRIGVAAIAVGVVIPVLIPGLRGGVPHGGGGGLGFGSGGSASAVAVNPIVTIKGQLNASQSRPVLSVRTTDTDPGYLRLTSLDQFDGTTFSPSTLQAGVDAQVSRGIQAPPVDGQRESADITVSNLATQWLPVPQQVVSVDVSGDWRYERASNTVFSARDDTQGLNYHVISVTPDLTASALEQATNTTTDPSVERLLELPDNIPASVRELTARVTADAPSPFDKAVAIQHFLNSAPFTYDLNADETDSADALAHFLLVSRRGFCQQFATSMAVMARIVHIPSRIAVGFTHGDQQQDGSWLVTTRNAHAWPELYFSGFGWVPFEPTPRSDGQAEQPSYTLQPLSPTPGDKTKTGADGKGGKADKKPAVSKNKRFDDLADTQAGDAGPDAAAPTPASHAVRNAAIWALAAIGFVLLLLPSVARVLTRRRRWRHAQSAAERAEAAWAELRASAIDARAGWLDGLSPRATARVLRAETAGLATTELRALDRIVETVQRAWYAPQGQGSVATDTLEEDVDDLRVAMFADATLRERFVLHAWPRSTMHDARLLVARFGDVLDALDLAGAKLRARLRLRHAD